MAPAVRDVECMLLTRQITTLQRRYFLFAPQAAEIVVLAAAMLRGGTSSQQKEAAAFVEAELAKHDKEESDGLTEKLKEIVKTNEDGVWVSTM